MFYIETAASLLQSWNAFDAAMRLTSRRGFLEALLSLLLLKEAVERRRLGCVCHLLFLFYFE